MYKSNGQCSANLPSDARMLATASSILVDSLSLSLRNIVECYNNYIHRIVHFVVLVSLFYIEFNELNWYIFPPSPSTQSDLYRVRGEAGECLSEVWRIVE